MELGSQEKQETRNTILDFDKRLEEMHLEFQKYRQGDAERRPDLEKLERDMFMFSKRKIFDLELSKNLERIMFKFQNRKKIWLQWVEEYHKAKT